MLHHLANGVMMPRRYWRATAFLGVCTVLTFLGVQQQVNNLSSSPEYDTQWRHDASVPQGLLVDEESDAVRPDLGEARRGRVLVTGGAGVIGKQVVSRLLSVNTTVTVLDIARHSDELEHIQAQYPNADLHFVQGDIRDPVALAEAIGDGVLGTIHLAGYSRIQYCLENLRDCEDVNVDGTDKLLQALKGDGWFILASSSEVYGDGVEVYGQAPTFPVREDAALVPVNAYGKTKIEAEECVRVYVHGAAVADKNINAAILRLSTVYGSAADHQENFVVDAMEKALAHRPIQVAGDPVADLIHVQDVVNAIAVTVNHLNKLTYVEERTGDIEIYNIGTKESIKATDYVRKIMWLTNSSSPLQSLEADPNLPKRYEADVTRAKEVMDWEAKITIDEGLHRLAKVYLADTVEYLSRKQQHECRPHRSYGINDLLKLHGCSGTLAADVDGQPFYAFWDPDMKEDPNNGKQATPAMYGWRDDSGPQAWEFQVRKKGRRAQLSLKRFVPDSKDGDGKVVEPGKWIQFEAINPENPLRHEIYFTADVDPDTGYVSLSFPSGPMLVPWVALPPPGGKNEEMPDHTKTALGDFRFRLTPFCCPGRQAPWPFFRDDPVTANVLDYRLEKTRVFNASQINMLCSRLKDAQGLAEVRLERLKSDPAPHKLELAPFPMGRPFDWRNRGRDVCTNLCDHPTLCVDTGNCACGQAACSTKPRFPFAAFANRRLNTTSYPAEVSWEWDGLTDDAQTPSSSHTSLQERVNEGSWLNVLHPYARRYLMSNPHYHPVTVTAIPAEEEKERLNDPDKFNRVQTEWHGCFSADSVMERATQLISTEYKKDSSLVFLPYYSYTQRFKPVEEWAKNALQHNLPSGVDVADFIIPFTFDFGKCNTIIFDLYRVRDWSSAPDVIERASSWQTMGDLNSPCYDMDQDVVIPARTCRQEDLRSTFSLLDNVKPSHQRSTLVFFKGAPNGAGASVRYKVACERPYQDISGKLTGANELARYWNEYNPNTKKLSDPTAYVETLGDTVFCPVPRGTAGWSPRITDTIYAGCIPVLLGDQTHEPFWDMLDWSKFSVQINDYEIERLEQILMSYSWAEVEEMQANLMLVREAFLYPKEGHMDDNLKGHGPFFFAMHTASLLKRTTFPI